MFFTLSSASVTAQSLDEQLLDNLNSELLDGLETIPLDETAGDPKTAAEAEGETASSPDEDAFARISKRMREAEQLIPNSEAVKTTRKVQREIVTDLDKLIAELEKQCQKCQSASSSSSQASQPTGQRDAQNQPSQPSGPGEQDANKPARDSTERLGKDEVRKADMAQMKSLLKDLWGQLPTKAREQMLQSSPEQFLPKYELMIEDYYKRLAEERGK